MQLRKANIGSALNNPNIFRDIAGFDNYKVSYNGLVYSLLTNKYLNPGITKSTGYLSVVLYSSTKKQTFLLHRLVAQAFLPNPNNKRTVNHLLGNKRLNHVDFLEWATHKENNRHAVAAGLRKMKCTPKVVDDILALHVKGDKKLGAKALAEKYQINKCTVHEILNKYKYNGTN